MPKLGVLGPPQAAQLLKSLASQRKISEVLKFLEGMRQHAGVKSKTWLRRFLRGSLAEHQKEQLNIREHYVPGSRKKGTQKMRDEHGLKTSKSPQKGANG